MMSHEGKEGRDRKRKICQTTEMLRDGLFNPHGVVTSIGTVFLLLYTSFIFETSATGLPGYYL